MDLWVQKAQSWLNNRFSSVAGYDAITEDGIAGWGTMYALTRGLQRELGIGSLSNNFGDGTSAAFTAQVGTLSSTTKDAGLVGILQCALWCKGYSGDTEFGKWSDTVSASVGTVRSQLGLSSGSSVDVKLMRSLLTLDAYVIIANGRPAVRSAQQWLNARYASHSTYRLVPCDGIYSRDVQYGFMLGVQYEIGMADSVANGNFGPGTQAGLKEQAAIGSGSNDGGKKWVSLFQIALIFNGYDLSRDGNFGASTVSTTTTFQNFLQISASGRGDYDTWAALLVSTGNPDRAVSGVDTSTKVSKAFAQELRSSGYSVIGRYLTVEAKSIARGELDTLFEAGFSVVPILQNFNNCAKYFTREIGYEQGYQAAMRARQLGFGANTIIFFPVDYDAFATEVKGVLEGYFEGVASGLRLSRTVPYKIGVYGTRYVADAVYQNGWAEAIWVSGMSTGYSGNLGYPMPRNWSYNQIQEIHANNIDRNAVSSSARPARRADVTATPSMNERTWQAHFEITRLFVLAERALSRQPLLDMRSSGGLILWYLQAGKYDSEFWLAYTPLPDITGPMAPAWAIARSDLLNDAGPLGQSLDRMHGDTQHMAATAHGVYNWGDAAGQSSHSAGDLGGWSADLLTLWADYRGPLGSGRSVSSFVDQYLGGTSGGSFGYDDLVADAQGWLIGARMREGASLWDAYRLVQIAAPEDKLLLRGFIRDRFAMTTSSTNQVLAGAINSLFLGLWPWSSAGRTAFLRGADGPTDSELTELKQAVTDRLCKLTGVS